MNVRVDSRLKVDILKVIIFSFLFEFIQSRELKDNKVIK